jgi:hypothetical protein
MPITSIPDHVAIAVPTITGAATRWHDQLGGGWVMPRFPLEAAGFATRQLRYRGGAKLELLEPLGPDTFASQFLARYGANVHHVTLKVPALLPAVETVRAGGFDVVDVFTEGDVWHEAFLRPSQVGGMIVQLAWAGRDDAEWAALTGATPEEPGPHAAILHGPTLTNPDLAAAQSLWHLLGAEVSDHDGGLTVQWPGSPLNVRIESGERAGAVGLRFDGTPPQAADPDLGPATLLPHPPA